MLDVELQLPGLAGFVIASGVRGFERKGLFSISCKSCLQGAEPAGPSRSAVHPSSDIGRSKNQRTTSQDDRLFTWSMQ
jgi:hypothetical protein